MAAPPPFPPPELVFRVSASTDLGEFDRIGRASREAVDRSLTEGWDWNGKRMLDFGCGAGRMLRHYLEEAAAGAEIEGCDHHAGSVEWMRDNLCPPLEVFPSGERPPLPVADGRYDLVVAVSVFTHIVRGWSEWLLELHRVLRPGGLLLATFHGPGMGPEFEAHFGVPYDEERTGMLVVPTGPDGEFANVFHSPWWLRAHWGRAFEILRLDESGFGTERGRGHGVLVMRRRESDLESAALERPEPGEPREAAAQAHAIEVLFDFGQRLRERSDRVEAELGLARSRLQALEGSRSWRLTRPLRAAGAAIRARGRRAD
jgi:SAM-dependent methyltransferase